MSVFTIFGDIKRINRSPQVDGESIGTVLGDVKVDFSRAPLDPGEHRVSLFTVFGDITLRVPEHVGVEIEGMTIFSEVEVATEPGGEEEQTGPSYQSENYATAPVRLRFSVFGVFGDIDLTRVAVEATEGGYSGETRRLERQDAPAESYERETTLTGR